jgi:hypothetical protein
MELRILPPVPPTLTAARAWLGAWARRPLAPENWMWTVAVLGLVVGFALRVWSIRQARFGLEEVWFWSVGRDIATGTEFPVLGAPISGSAARLPGSGYFFFLGLTQLFGASPLRAFAVVSLGGLALLVPLSLAVSRAFDRATGLAFFLLAAVSPWWVVYTNSLWPGYFFPSLCALVLLGLPALADRPRPLTQAALLFLLVVGFQMHLSLMHYWLLALVTAALWRPRLTRGLLIGLAVGALCYVPYLVYEVRTGFVNTLAIAHRSQGGPRSPYVLQGLLLYFLGFTTTDLSYLWHQGFWHLFDLARFWRGEGVDETRTFFGAQGLPSVAWAALVASWLLTAVAWLAFVPVIVRRLRADLRAPANVLVVAFVTGVVGIPIFYLLSGKGGYPHYVSAMLPLAFLPPAVLLGRAFRHRWGRWAAGAYLLLFALGGTLGLRGYYAYDSRWSVPQTEAAVAFALERTRAQDGTQRPFQFVMGFGPNWPVDYQLVARQVFQAPFPMVDRADDVIRLDARSPARDERADADTLVLDTIVVRHERRPAP